MVDTVEESRLLAPEKTSLEVGPPLVLLLTIVLLVP